MPVKLFSYTEKFPTVFGSLYSNTIPHTTGWPFLSQLTTVQLYVVCQIKNVG